MTTPLPVVIVLAATGYVGVIYLLLSLWARWWQRFQG